MYTVLVNENETINVIDLIKRLIKEDCPSTGEIYRLLTMSEGQCITVEGHSVERMKDSKPAECLYKRFFEISEQIELINKNEALKDVSYETKCTILKELKEKLERTRDTLNLPF